ncbi:MAG: hypothetical protein ACPHRI_05350, partial [Flavobacteriaceae bacterium]
NSLPDSLRPVTPDRHIISSSVKRRTMSHCMLQECQIVLLNHKASNSKGIELVYSNGEQKKIDQYHLHSAEAAKLFGRSGEISQIHIYFT